MEREAWSVHIYLSIRRRPPQREVGGWRLEEVHVETGDCSRKREIGVKMIREKPVESFGYELELGRWRSIALSLQGDALAYNTII